MNNKVTPIIDRYLAKVDKSGGPDACWPWTGSRDKGYGQIHAGPQPGVARNSRKPLKTHRFAYELEFGPIPDGMSVLHRCDNPPCCNPKHLFIGTQADNMHDMDEKLRRITPDRKGARHGMARLTEDDVRDIRRRYSTGTVTQAALACHFRVTQAQISSVVLRKSWSHIE